MKVTPHAFLISPPDRDQVVSFMLQLLYPREGVSGTNLIAVPIKLCPNWTFRATYKLSMFIYDCPCNLEICI